MILFLAYCAHARGDAQRGGDGRENRDDHLNDEFPGFAFHSRLVFCVLALAERRRAGE